VFPRRNGYRAPCAPSAGAARRPLNEAAGWNDPLALAGGYLTDVTEASAGLVDLEIVQWLIVRDFLDLSHRTEATMSHFYGGWQADRWTTTWARFAANERQSGTAAVGTCHYPPNGEKDYDWANPRVVESTADDWLHYPALTGRSRRFNCEEWAGPHLRRDGRPDYHRNYLRWWFTHLPRAQGQEAGGHVNNWWEYVFNFEKYEPSGRPTPGRRDIEARARDHQSPP